MVEPSIIGRQAYMREGYYKGIRGQVLRFPVTQNYIRYFGNFSIGFTGKEIDASEYPPYILVIYDDIEDEYCAIGVFRWEIFVIGVDHDLVNCSSTTRSGRGRGVTRILVYLGEESGRVKFTAGFSSSVRGRMDIYYGGRRVATTLNTPGNVTGKFYDPHDFMTGSYDHYETKIKTTRGFVKGGATLEFNYYPEGDRIAVVYITLDIIHPNSQGVWSFSSQCPIPFEEGNG